MAYYYPADVAVLEVHYLFNDYSHSLDAFLNNKCEADILTIIKAVSRICKTDVVVEIEPRGEGGLINRYRINARGSNANSSNGTQISKPLQTAILTAICIAPVTIAVNGINEVVKNALATPKTQTENVALKDSLDMEKRQAEIASILADIENKKGKTTRDSLENEKLKIDIKNAELDLRSRLIKANKNPSIIKRRSKFYSQLETAEKVNGMSLQIFNGFNIVIQPEYFVQKIEFAELAADRSKQDRIMADNLYPFDAISYRSPLISDTIKRIGDEK